MTWGEFKRLVESKEGVTDETEIRYIDFSWRPEHIGLDGDGDLTIW